MATRDRTEPLAAARAALEQAAKAERRLIERERAAERALARALARLNDAEERLARAQERVSRRQTEVVDTEAALRRRQEARASGPGATSGAGEPDGSDGGSPDTAGDSATVASPSARRSPEEVHGAGPPASPMVAVEASRKGDPAGSEVTAEPSDDPPANDL